VQCGPFPNVEILLIAYGREDLLAATIYRRILLAIDGSDQALEAVRYAGAVFPPESTELVLFSVGTGFPEVYWDLGRNPLYQTQRPKVMGWLADNQLAIGEFKAKAYKILEDAGFAEKAVKLKTQVKKTSILNDIIQESYQEYSALVVGRTGVSKSKDLLVGSLAGKLVKIIKHIPTIIVGGSPDSSRFLIAMDESIEAMRGVNSVGVLAGSRNPEVTLCHMIKLPGRFHLPGSRPESAEKGQQWLEYSKNKFKPYMDEATGRLIEAGVEAERISPDFLVVRGSPVRKVLETARNGNYGTIVVGRRQALSFVEEHIWGRFSEKTIKMAENMAVWTIS